MGVPSGEVIARPMVARACGCLQEFQHYAVDRYRAQRLAKFQKTRCTNCVAKLNEEQRVAAAALPKKGEAFKLLPVGSQVSISRVPDGTWAGKMTADGTTVEGTGEGPQGLIVTLARLWVSAKGLKPPPELDAPAPAPIAKSPVLAKPPAPPPPAPRPPAPKPPAPAAKVK
jgi:hypothetical protein